LGCLAHDNIGNSQRVSDDCFSGLLVRANRSSKAVCVLFDCISQFCQFSAAVHRVLDQVFERIGAFHVLQDCIGDIGYIDAGLAGAYGTPSIVTCI